jgi:hypothetical protein
MKEPARSISHEPRWPPVLAVLLVLYLLIVLPDRYRQLPHWGIYLFALALLVPIIGASATKANTVTICSSPTAPRRHSAPPTRSH